jgi:hypothetical protein
LPFKNVKLQNRVATKREANASKDDGKQDTAEIFRPFLYCFIRANYAGTGIIQTGIK